MARVASWRTAYPLSAEVFDAGHGIRVVLPIVPPSANELKRHTGIRVAAAIRKATKKWLGDALLKATAGTPGLNRVTGKRRVQIVCYRGRELDADNTSAGCKPITDELVEAGLLQDDGPKWCDLRPVVQVVVKTRGQWRTEAYIEAVS